eukprot:104451_1
MASIFLTYLKLCTIIVAVASQLQKISPADTNTGDHDNFGWSVSIHDQFLAVGAPSSQNTAQYGTVRLFTIDSATQNWVQTTSIIAPDGTTSDLFGYSVSIYDPYLIIGAHKNDENDQDSGSAYIFALASGSWSFIHKATASDGMASDMFGRAVSIYDAYAVIGAAGHDANGANSGAAYIFQATANVWTQSAKLLPNNALAGDNFGCSVAIYDTFVVVGAYSHDSLTPDYGLQADAGGAYVFERTNNNWAQHTKLLPYDAAVGDWFGISVAIHSDLIIVGACYSGNNAGSAYVFAFDAALDTWTAAEPTKLVPSDAMDNQQFGRSVSIHGKYAVVGTYEQLVGSAYVFGFDAVNNEWTEIVKLVPGDGLDHDKFGHAVANYYGNVVIGAPYVDDNGVNSGSVYVTEMIDPSTDPSASPSLLPSTTPSDAPSSNPSITPSNHPTDAPSVLPSDAPSNNPSDAPSNNPSVLPSGTPSAAPSNNPSEESVDNPNDDHAAAASVIFDVIIGACMLYNAVCN